LGPHDDDTTTAAVINLLGYVPFTLRDRSSLLPRTPTSSIVFYDATTAVTTWTSVQNILIVPSVFSSVLSDVPS